MRLMNRQMTFVLAGLLLAAAGRLSAQGTAFNYQGQLSNGGAPANGSFDVRFAVYDAVTNGIRVSAWRTNSAVPVSNGLFAVTLDFGPGLFTGTNYWLDIAVKATNVTAFTSLVPRQPILPVPYAVFANGASNVLGPVAATQLSGTVGSSQIAGTYAGAVNFNNGANDFAGTFVGDGSGLANLNGSAIASGTVADARLTANVALLDHNQAFTGANIFTNVGNRFTGSFFGNGNVGWDAFSGPDVQAEFNHGYLLTNSQLATVTLPLTPASSEGTNVGYIVRVSGAGTGGWRVAQNAGQSIYGNFLTAVSSDWHLATTTGKGLDGIASSADGFKMVAVAGSGGIFTSVDSGKTWNNSSSSLMTCVASSSDGSKLAAGNNANSSSSIILSINSGSTWSSQGTVSVPKCQGIASSADGTRLVAVGKSDFIYTSVNSGTNWTKRNSSPVGNALNWYSVASSSDGSKLAAVVNGGHIYTSSDYGANWTSQSGSPLANWYAIASSSDGSQLAAVVDGGNIYLSSDYGATWTIQTNAPADHWRSVDCSADGSRIIAAIYGGGIYLSAIRGGSWIKLPVDNQNWTGVACNADCTKMAAVYNANSTSGGIYYGQAYFQATAATTTTGTAGSIGGSQGTSVELQYIGNNRFMPVSSTGTIWAN
jgi:hypothetical protein